MGSRLESLVTSKTFELSMLAWNTAPFTLPCLVGWWQDIPPHFTRGEGRLGVPSKSVPFGHWICKQAGLSPLHFEGRDISIDILCISVSFQNFRMLGDRTVPPAGMA